MRTKLLYHGTKSKDIESVMNKPLMKPSANGYGLYLTTSKELASAYGEVIAFVVPYDFEVDTMRLIEGYEDTKWEGAIEYVINTQATWVKFMRALEDVYHETNVIPF